MHVIQQSPSSSGCSSSCQPERGPAPSALDNPETGKDRGTQSIKFGFSCGRFIALLRIYTGCETCSRRCTVLDYSLHFLIDIWIIPSIFW